MKFAMTYVLGQALFAVVAAPAVLLAEPRFEDRSAALPVQHAYIGGWEHFVGGGVALFDCNGDARIDLYAAGGDSPAQLLINATAPGGDIRFTAGQGEALTGVTGAYPLDIDGDGHVDLAVLRVGANMLLRGDGACGFSDASQAWGFEGGDRWSTAFSAMWEGDGFPTLAIGNYVDRSDPDGPFETCDTNWLMRPTLRATGQSYANPTPLEPGFCPLSMLFSDWQRSGATMLRVSNDRQYYVNEGYEQMFALTPLRELGEPDGWPRLKLWGMGIASQDLTGDGLPEVMLTSMGDQVLMDNTGDGFAAASFTRGSTAHRPFVGDDGRPSTGWHAEFGDVDNDGRADVFIAKGNVDQMPGMAMQDPNNLLMQQPDGRFEERADVAGLASPARSRGAGLVDLNSDGLLDVVVVNRRAPLEIWQNATTGAGNHVAVQLRQPGGNTHAIGAVVQLRSGSVVQTQELTIGGGHVSGRLSPLHFGIGQHSSAEIRVIWPDKSVRDWSAIEINRTTRITR